MHVICIIARVLRRLRWVLWYPDWVYKNNPPDAYLGPKTTERMIPSLSLHLLVHHPLVSGTSDSPHLTINILATIFALPHRILRHRVLRAIDGTPPTTCPLTWVAGGLRTSCLRFREESRLRHEVYFVQSLDFDSQQALGPGLQSRWAQKQKTFAAFFSRGCGTRVRENRWESTSSVNAALYARKKLRSPSAGGRTVTCDHGLSRRSLSVKSCRVLRKQLS